MSKELAIQETSSIAIEEARRRYNMVVEFTKSMMIEGKDYGKIPGTDKPTLLKPGAEKLASLFEFVPEFIPLNEVADFDKGLFYFRYKCQLYRNSQKAGEGIGSCNNMEKKYRYRHIPEWKATDDEKNSAIRREERTSRNGKPYTMLVVENTEPFELVNTIDKMAQKRAFIAATLIAANASEFFTQDVEDLNVIEGEFVEDDGHKEPEGEVTKDAPSPTKPKKNGNGKPASLLQKLVDAGIAENIPNASAIANKLHLGDLHEVDAIEMAKQYRALRDEGKTSKEAAAEVLAEEISG